MTEQTFSRYRTAPRGREVYVALLNLEKLGRAFIEAYVAEQNASGRSLDVSNFAPVKMLTAGVVVSKQGKVAVVNTEGVGAWANDEDKIYVWSLMNGSMAISVDVIMQCLSGQGENLADFVRTFGERLEDNFDIWYSFATRE